jgi:hypothetical protein
MGDRGALKMPLKTSGCILYAAPTGSGHSSADVASFRVKKGEGTKSNC